MHFKCYYFPLFWSFLCTHKRSFHLWLCVYWRCAEACPPMSMQPAAIAASKTSTNDTGCTKTVTRVCLSAQLIWAVQEFLLWCFVCTRAQIKAIAPLIKQKARGKINNLIYRQKMDVGVKRKSTTFLECSLWSRWSLRPVLLPDSRFSGNIKASANDCLRPTVLGKVVTSQCSTPGGWKHGWKRKIDKPYGTKSHHEPH